MGSTTTIFRLRFNNNKSRIRAHSRVSLHDKSRDDLICQHFCGPAHNGIEDVSIQLIDQVNDENDLLREHARAQTGRLFVLSGAFTLPLSMLIYQLRRN